MLTFHDRPNADSAVIALLNELGVNISTQLVTDELEKHPDYPSMLAISDVLNWFGIKNAAYRVLPDELQNIPAPFIAFRKNKEFITVSKMANGHVTFTDHKHRNQTITTGQFKQLYGGTVLVAENPDSAATTRQNIADRLAPYKDITAVAGLCIAFIGIMLLFTNYTEGITWQVAALTVLKTAGSVTSVLLLVQSINKNNPLVQTLCGGGNSKTNCNAILTSKAATVFKGLTWSEVGFFYFAGTWLALLFGGRMTGLLPLLALLNLISLPYTVYSINYQARIAKQWCVLCTTVQALLWLEFIPLLSYLRRPLGVTANAGTALFIFMLIPVAAWLLLKPLLLKSQQLRTLKGQLQKFKYDRELFKASLKEQPKYALPADDWSIVLGNVEANTIITMVSNPYCPPCSKTHTELDEWLDKLDDIQLRIVFTANNNDGDIKTPVTRHLMALNDQADKATVKRALHDWYGQKQKNYEAWAKLYPVTLDESRFTQLEQQREWCNMAEVKATPTLLINGYRLPEAYRIHDIKYLLV